MSIMDHKAASARFLVLQPVPQIPQQARHIRRFSSVGKIVVYLETVFLKFDESGFLQELQILRNTRL